MKNTCTLISLALALVVAGSVAAGQTSKIAYVDSDIILRDLPEAQRASRELEELVSAFQDTLQKMNEEFDRMLEDYQKQEGVMAPARKEQEQRRLTELDQRRRTYFAQRLDPRTGEAAVARERKLAPIREKILKAIESIAKEEGFNFVFDRSNVLYADAKVDLTYKVLDRLKRGTPAPRGR